VPIVQVNAASVDLEQRGGGRDLVILHSLPADRSAFDRVAPPSRKAIASGWSIFPATAPRAPSAPVLKDIGNRTLVMVGSDDATTPPALARELSAKIPQARRRGVPQSRMN
jgi:hypothetical protein